MQSIRHGKESEASLERVAVLTPHGRGAVATLRHCGSASTLDGSFRAANGRSLAEQTIGRIVFGRWGAEPAEEVVVVRCSAAETEIHCHGGAAAVQRILEQLQASGCRVESWQEQLATQSGLLELECTAALTRAVTLRTATILLDQLSGTLRTAFERLRILPPDDNASRKHALDKLLRWSRFGLHLTTPWTVVLAGRPNAGKSSLINRLVGYTRSIVYDEPGTTRDVVTAETAFDGWPVQLADTAGLREQAGELEAAGIIRARGKLATADLQVLVLDTSVPPDSADLELLAAFPQAIVVGHKSDLPNAWGSERPPAAIAVSSLTDAGLDQLIAAISTALAPAVPACGVAVPLTDRQVGLLQRAHEALTAGVAADFDSAVIELLASETPTPGQ